MTNTALATLPLSTGTWTADPSHTTVGFTVRHLGLSKVRGRFEGVTAQVDRRRRPRIERRHRRDRHGVGLHRQQRPRCPPHVDRLLRRREQPEDDLRVEADHGRRRGVQARRRTDPQRHHQAGRARRRVLRHAGVPRRPVDPRRILGDRIALPQGLRHRVQHGARWRQGDDLRQGGARTRRPARRPAAA